MRRGSWIALAAVALVLGLPALGAGVFLATIDPAAVKAQAIEAVQRATGRQLSVSSLRLTLLPELTLDATNAALSNPAGFSRPAMASVRNLHAQIGLLPLLFHRVVLRELTLQGLDLKLEQVPGQPPNWVFATPRAPAALPHALPAQTAPPRRIDRFSLLGITADGTVTWQIPGFSGAVDVASLRAQEVNTSSTISLAAKLSLGGEAVALDGRFGGQNHLWNAQDRSDWPVAVKLSADAGQIQVNGSISRPLALSGYDLTIAAHGPDLGRLAQPWPWLTVPRLRDAVLDARVVDRLDGIDVPHLSLSAGLSDLSDLAPGLQLNDLAVDAPNIDGTNGTQMNRLRAEGQYAAQALALNASFGPIGRLFGRGQVSARSPIALDATALAAGASLRLAGRVAPAGDWRGTDATLTASVPDLAALSPLARTPLPRLRDLTLTARVRSVGGVLSLQGAHLTLPQAELTAQGEATLGGRPRYSGQLHIAHVDFDALTAAWPRPPATSSGAAPIQATAPAGWVIPDQPLPLDRFGGFDADIGVAADTLIRRGVTVTGLAAHLRLQQGRLDLNPFSASIAGAPLTAGLTVDTSQTPPPLTLRLAAAGLNAAILGALAGAPDDATGSLDLTAGLTGAGSTPHAIAASLSGHVGAALTGGSLANAALVRALEYITPAARLGLDLPTSGRSDIACLATGLDLRQGVAVPQAFLLDTRLLRLAAAGAIDLRDETFALRLRPYVRLGATGLVLPSRADGSWRDPHLTLEPASGVTSAATLASGLAGGNSGLSDLLASLAEPSEAMLALADSGDCGPALAAAHDTTGAAIAPPPQTAGAKPRRQRALDLLRKLFK